jgi:hypothetical protein
MRCRSCPFPYGTVDIAVDRTMFSYTRQPWLGETRSILETSGNGICAPPAQVVSHLTGALTSSLTPRQARIDQPRCCILAPHARDDTHRSPPELLASSKGQGRAARGVRFLQAPQFFASSFYRQTPERLMAVLLVITVCLLGYAALAYRIRQAAKPIKPRCRLKRANGFSTRQRGGSSTLL